MPDGQPEPTGSRKVSRRAVLKAVGAGTVAACGAQLLPGRLAGAQSVPVAAPRLKQGPSASMTPITNVVIIMLENHTFDNYFGAFPGANGVVSAPAPNPMGCDINHTRCHYEASFNAGMDGFDARGIITYSQSDIPILWAYAQQFGLSDNFFTSAAASSSPNHIYMIAAQSSGLDETTNLDNSQGKLVSGCFSPPNNLTGSISPEGTSYLQYPCLDIGSVPQLLDNAGVSWRYYCAEPIWLAPWYIPSICRSPNIITNDTQIFTDIEDGALAGVSWVCPDWPASDHPPRLVELGQNYIANLCNAIMNSRYWESSAIFVTWDDWGGLYDHVRPPVLDSMGLGPRVPLLVVSPYAVSGYISHELAEFSSLAKFVEANWGLPSLGQRDANPQVSDLMDFFDFSQAPQPPFIQAAIPVNTTLEVYPNPAVIQPIIGGPATMFTFIIGYTAAQPPTVQDVVIDGNSYAMTLNDSNPEGLFYTYEAKLAPGTHQFSFNFEANGEAVVLPNNGLTYSVDVMPFNLINQTYFPSLLAGSNGIFQVLYTSPEGRVPTVAQLELMGVTYDMERVSGTPAKGLTLRCEVPMQAGFYYYRFIISDGTATGTYEQDETTYFSDLLLSDGTVSPASGTPSTEFTFGVTYADANGAEPTTAVVYVGSTAYAMSYVSGNVKTGALYQAKTQLPAGKHQYTFVFSDGSTSYALPLGAAPFNGPSVS